MTAGGMTVTGIVLAGGRSSRFGGDKLAEDLDGRSVLAATVAVVRLVADEIVVAGRTGGLEGVRFVADERPDEGPLGGIATGLHAATGHIVLVVGGDMPRLHPGVLQLLIDRVAGPGNAVADRDGAGRAAAGDAVADRAVAAVLEEAGIPRPLPVAMRREPAMAAVAACLASGDRSLRGFLARLGVRIVPAGEWRAIDAGGATLLDVDTPADLERLRHLA